MVGHLVGTRSQLLEAVALFAAVFFDDPQCGGLILRGHYIKVVQRPVEGCQLWPAEVAHGGVVVGAVGQEEITGR
ncbi:hypothetical protein D3C78_636330 [compost metagenome]